MDSIAELLKALLNSIELEEKKINLQRQMVVALYKEKKIRFTEEQKKLVYKLLIAPKFGSIYDWLEIFTDGDQIKAKQLQWNRTEAQIRKELEKKYGDKNNA